MDVRCGMECTAVHLHHGREGRTGRRALQVLRRGRSARAGILPPLLTAARVRRPGSSPFTTRFAAITHNTSSRRGTPTQHQSVVRARANTTLAVCLGNSNTRFKLLEGHHNINTRNAAWHGWAKRGGMGNEEEEAINNIRGEGRTGRAK